MHHKFTYFFASCHGICLIFLFLSIPVSILYPNNPYYYTRCLLILIPFLLSAYGIHRIPHLALYLLLALATIAALLGIGTSLAEKIYFSLAGFLLFFARIPARLNKQKDFFESPSPLFLFLFLAVYICGYLTDYPMISESVYWLTFAYLIILLFYINFGNLAQFLKQNQDVANLPGYQITSTNRFMLGLFTILALFFMILFPSKNIVSFFHMLGRLLQNGLRALLSSDGEVVEEIIPEPTPSASPGASDYSGMPQGEPAPAWLTAIFNILSFLFGGLICLLILAGLIYSIMQIFRRFYQPHKENTDKQEFIRMERKKDFISRSEKQQKEPSIRFSFHPNAVIRRTYKKALKKGLSTNKAMERHDLFNMTPSELEQTACWQQTDAEQTLHELYEKARYSKEGCSKEDTVKAKI